jgi:hypothetical protein
VFSVLQVGWLNREKARMTYQRVRNFVRKEVLKNFYRQGRQCYDEFNSTSKHNEGKFNARYNARLGEWFANAQVEFY